MDLTIIVQVLKLGTVESTNPPYSLKEKLYFKRSLVHFLIECHLYVRNRSLSNRAVKYVHKLALYILGHVWAYGYPFINRYIISRIFAYARVSTIEQDTQNQIAEIKAAGFTVK